MKNHSNRELDTPSLLIDLDRLETNILKMAAFVKSQGINLRPHTKTHKCPEIAKMQIKAGAVGISCAKIGEAEVMAAAGLEDIFIANEIIGEQKFMRLIELSKKVNLCIAVDSLFGAKSLNAALEQARQKLDVVIEINCGQNRSGVLPEDESLQFAKEMTTCNYLKLRGLMTHGVIESFSKFEIGERVRIIPNHVCVVVNMFDELFGIRNSRVEQVFKIEGRGKML